MFGSVYRVLSSIVCFVGLARLTSFVGFIGLAGLVSLVGVGLLSNNVSADDDIDKVNIVVPSSCSFSDEVIPGDTEHSATMHNNEYKSDIGTTTFKAYCNDNNGYSVYAIGYSNDTYGNTNMIHDTDSTYNFDTGTASSGNTSTWSMKLTPVAGTYAPTIQSDTNGAYTNYHVVPSTYTKVATFPNRTDVPATGTGIGSAFQTTYAVWISNSQVAGTYTGKVRYTLVHPNNEAAPPQPQISEPGKICYYANASNAVGTMGCQTIPTTGTADGVSPTSATLLASNFSRDGYGFAGWSNKFDYATNTDSDLKFYGPQEDISFIEGQYAGNNEGLSLYAVWVPSVGSLQDSVKVASLCGVAGSLTAAPAPGLGVATLSSVSALTDLRDNQTYAIAKLVDGNCWMIENLRLQSTNSDNSTGDLAQGYGKSATYGDFSGLADAEDAANFSNQPLPNSLYSVDGSGNTINIGATNAQYRFPRYNNINTPSSVQDRPHNPTTNLDVNSASGAGMYSYGNYYSWPAAVADVSNLPEGDYIISSICPTGWTIPLGNASTGNIDQGPNDINNRVPGFSFLDRKLGGTGLSQSSAFRYWRKYPNNFVLSGGTSSGSIGNLGKAGGYWASTAITAYRANGLHLGLSSSNTLPGMSDLNKFAGRSIRCVFSGE